MSDLTGVGAPKNAYRSAPDLRGSVMDIVHLPFPVSMLRIC